MLFLRKGLLSFVPKHCLNLRWNSGTTMSENREKLSMFLQKQSPPKRIRSGAIHPGGLETTILFLQKHRDKFLFTNVSLPDETLLSMARDFRTKDLRQVLEHFQNVSSLEQSLQMWKIISTFHSKIPLYDPRNETCRQLENYVEKITSFIPIYEWYHLAISVNYLSNMQTYSDNPLSEYPSFKYLVQDLQTKNLELFESCKTLNKSEVSLYSPEGRSLLFHLAYLWIRRDYFDNEFILKLSQNILNNKEIVKSLTKEEMLFTLILLRTKRNKNWDTENSALKFLIHRLIPMSSLDDMAIICDVIYLVRLPSK